MPDIRVVDGLAGGAVAGLAQAVILALGAALLRKPLSWFFILIGYLFRPYTATPDSDVRAIVRGFLTHMVITTVLGGLFAVLAPFLPGEPALWLWGIVYAVIVWAVGRFLLLRTIDPTLDDQFNTWLFLFTHLVYGSVLGWWVSRV